MTKTLILSSVISLCFRLLSNGPLSEAADIILHIWYFARISIKVSRAIRIYVCPLVEGVIPKIKDKVTDDYTFENLEVRDQEPTLIASQKAMACLDSKPGSLVCCRESSNRTESASSHPSADKAELCGSINFETA